MKITEFLSREAQPVWDMILNHPFLKEIARGELPEDTFNFWAKQDYIFVREAERFIGILIAKAPRYLQPPLIMTLNGLENELKMFEEYASKSGFSLENVERSVICGAYIDFLLTTAYNEDFNCGFTILYGAEKAYLDSWLSVKKQVKGETPYIKFIENWTSPAFEKYVNWLGDELNSLTNGIPRSQQDKLLHFYRLAGQYEYLFWEMSYKKQTF